MTQANDPTYTVTPEDVVHALLGVMRSDVNMMAKNHEGGRPVDALHDWAVYADLAAKKFGIDSPDGNPWYIYITDCHTKALSEEMPYSAWGMDRNEYAIGRGFSAIGMVGAAIEQKFAVKTDYSKIPEF